MLRRTPNAPRSRRFAIPQRRARRHARIIHRYEGVPRVQRRPSREPTRRESVLVSAIPFEFLTIHRIRRRLSSSASTSSSVLRSRDYEPLPRRLWSPVRLTVVIARDHRRRLPTVPPPRGASRRLARAHARNRASRRPLPPPRALQTPGRARRVAHRRTRHPTTTIARLRRRRAEIRIARRARVSHEETSRRERRRRPSPSRRRRDVRHRRESGERGEDHTRPSRATRARTRRDAVVTVAESSRSRGWCWDG